MPILFILHKSVPNVEHHKTALGKVHLTFLVTAFIIAVWVHHLWINGKVYWTEIGHLLANNEVLLDNMYMNGQILIHWPLYDQCIEMLNAIYGL